MAEYIDKQKYREEWLKFKTFEPMKCLDSIPIADVVERPEYDKMVESFKTMVEMKNEDLIAMRDKYYTLEKDYAELKVKIDKAIEEINDEINSDFWNSSFEGGLQNALEILKRNIGE